MAIAQVNNDIMIMIIIIIIIMSLYSFIAT